MNLQYNPDPKNSLYPIINKNHNNLNSSNFLKVAFNKGTYIIKHEEILYLKSESSYTMIYLENGKKILSSKTLKSYSKVLPVQEFMRVHRSYIIPISKIEIIYNSPSQVQIKGHIIPVSKNYKNNLKDFFL